MKFVSSAALFVSLFTLITGELAVLLAAFIAGILFLVSNTEISFVTVLLAVVGLGQVALIPVFSQLVSVIFYHKYIEEVAEVMV